MKLYLLLGIVLASLSLAGCGRPFDAKTAPGFVELSGQSWHEWRATTPEGVVIGVHVVQDEDRGDLAFWSETVTLQLRDMSGYALLATKDVVSADGTRGRLLQFGHDEDGKPYDYWVAIFSAQRRLFVVES